jgi:hypothetical protein
MRKLIVLAALAAGIVFVGLTALVATGASSFPTSGGPSYLTLRLSGSAGPLRVGMTQAAATHYLHFPSLGGKVGGVECHSYDVGIGKQRGFAGACFDRTRHLVAFTVSGAVFCFQAKACVNEHDVIPGSIRSRFRTVFNSRQGIYFSYFRERLAGRPYELVTLRPEYDRPGTIGTFAFAPCGANNWVKYFAPVDC